MNFNSRNQLQDTPPNRDRRERVLWLGLLWGFVLVGGHSLFLLFELIPENARRGQLDLHIWCGLCLLLPLVGYLIRHLSRLGTRFHSRRRIAGLMTACSASFLAVSGLLCLWIPSGIVGQSFALVHAWIGFLVLSLFLFHRWVR